jgi:two-component system sensor histidine kinase PilS (NtrC family)
MRSGILVVDVDGKVQLANASAMSFLGFPPAAITGHDIGQLLPELAAGVWQAWVREPRPPTRLLKPASREAELLVSITDLSQDSAGGTLMFLEDAAATRQRAQQLKLASLGHLTASIAHEIRNPLGAISHASQLLSESSSRSEEDQRLTRIIREHSLRVNTIIENVLKIGRRDNPVLESFAIKPWLSTFVDELRLRKHMAPEQILFTVEPDDLTVRMDASQLQQVLWNLCENALRYSRGTPALSLICGLKPMSDRPYLDVIDYGSGIPADIEDKIFEPFFTKDSQGTGLGLYIASELCESNQATLSLHSNSENGCCFRISFAHPDRQQTIF